MIKKALATLLLAASCFPVVPGARVPGYPPNCVYKDDSGNIKCDTVSREPGPAPAPVTPVAQICDRRFGFLAEDLRLKESSCADELTSVLKKNATWNGDLFNSDGRTVSSTGSLSFHVIDTCHVEYVEETITNTNTSRYFSKVCKAAFSQDGRKGGVECTFEVKDVQTKDHCSASFLGNLYQL
jgi:hypothetical protein